MLNKCLCDYIYGMTGLTLSIIIPAYNEAHTITRVLENIYAAELVGNVQKQVIVVDDASTDATATTLLEWQRSHPERDIIYLQHATNQGKGAAIHTGIGA